MKSNSNHFEDPAEVRWFAIRVEYRGEMAVKRYLDAKGIEHFLPMQYREVVAGRRKIRKLVPSVHNLIFIRTTKQQIDRIKSTTAYPIRYMMQRDGSRSHPIVVPDREMLDFIRVAGTFDDRLLYLADTDVRPREGDRVRILSGPFAGVTGIYMRVKGTRCRRVVVEVPGIAAVATASLPPSMIEVIESSAQLR